jgi:2-polyprenyl-6-methoxyphenol hydroxylase-like FAD-dependent oxidoreductase
LIVGGGIGGAALGVALARRGIEAEVVERRAALADGGAAIVLAPNVMAALGPLGLEEAAGALGSPVRRFTVMDERGAVLGRTSAEVPGYRWPGTAFLRSALHGLLHGALPAPARLGVTAERFEAHADGVDVAFSDGSKGRYTLVVGADGVRSTLREELNPGFRPRYSGQTCWRVVVADDEALDGAVELWGPGRRFGAVPIGAGRTYLYMTIDAPAGAPAAYADIDGFRAIWAGFGGPVPSLLARIASLDAVLHNDLEDGIPPRWSAPGRVLLGDAAHAVTPNLGQGAGLAIEDAACLAALLSEGGAVNDALHRYEALRRPRARWILDQSYRFGHAAHLRNGLLCALRDLAMRMTPESVNAATYARVVRDVRGVPMS